MLVSRWAFVAEAPRDERKTPRRIEWRTPIEPRELPEEWVLRQLMDADLEDDAAVIALLDYGAITWPYFDPAFVPEPRRELLAYLPNLDDGADWWTNRNDAAIEDIRWWLKTARALARMWSNASVGDDPTGAWSAEGFVQIEGAHASWGQFVLALDTGLRPFRAHAEYTVQTPRGNSVTFGLPSAGLYSAACREVFNLIAGEHTARRCENATCGRLFVHQLGDIEYRQHRRSVGLRFCTPGCARAETQRQYRRRKAAKRKEK